MSRIPKPAGPYPPCRCVGGLIYVSGQGPRRHGERDIPGVVLDSAGRVISYDIRTQVLATFENVRAILEAHGSSIDRIIDVLSFLTDLDRDFAGYNRAYAEIFPPGPNQPARTTVGVASLPTTGSAPIAYEAKVIATIQSPAAMQPPFV